MANYGNLSITLNKKENKKIKEFLGFLEKNVLSNNDNENKYYAFGLNNKGEAILLTKRDIENNKNINNYIFIKQLNNYENKETLSLVFEAKWGIPNDFIIFLSKKFDLIGKIEISYEIEYYKKGIINKGKIDYITTIYPEELFYIGDLLNEAKRKINKNIKNNINYKKYKRLYKKLYKGEGSLFGKDKIKIPRKIKKILNNPFLSFGKDSAYKIILQNNSKYSIKELKKISLSKLKRLKEGSEYVIKVEDLPF